MNIVIAIDSFKGSISSTVAGETAAEAVREVLGQKASVRVFPIADGGEGTVDALTAGLGGEEVRLEVTGPLGEKIQSRYGKVPQSRLAIIEMADAAGICLVPEAQLNPLHTTTFGLGEIIRHAVRAGCRDFIIGIGGSATNDAGLGMLTALGAKFYDEAGKPVGIFGRDIVQIASIDLQGMDPLLNECRFRIACDVTNPLYGENGCSAIYGPQKGATPSIVSEMDSAIKRFAQLAERELGLGDPQLPGAGAAGGLGYAFNTFLGGTLMPGVSLIINAIGLEKALSSADVVITGEGRMDAQTAMGKAPAGVASLARRLRPEAVVTALCGCAEKNAEAVSSCGIDAYFPILHMPMTTAEAMAEETTRQNIRQTTAQISRLIQAARQLS